MSISRVPSDRMITSIQNAKSRQRDGLISTTPGFIRRYLLGLPGTICAGNCRFLAHESR